MATGSLLRESIVAVSSRRAIDGLSASGFRPEAVYLAGCIYTAPWPRASATYFARRLGLIGLFDVIGRSGHRRLWSSPPIDPRVVAALRTHFQLNSWGEHPAPARDMPQLLQYRLARYMLPSELIGLGETLAKSRNLPLAATTLAGAARPGVAEKVALDRLGDVVADLPARSAPQSLHAPRTTVPVNRAAHLLAGIELYSAATMARLVGKIPELDERGYEALVRRLFDVTESITPRDPALANAKIEIGCDLWGKGYWAQALDVLDSTLNVSPWDRARWKRLWDTVADPELAAHVQTATAVASLIAPGPRKDRALTRALDELGVELLDVEPQNTLSVEAAPATPALDSTEDFAQLTVGLPPERKSSTQRRAIVAITRLPAEALAYRVRVRIGVPQVGESGEPFKEPDWGEREYLDLRLTLDGLEAQVTPAWHELRLPRRGDSDHIDFRVLAQREGELQLSLRIYTASDFLLLEEYDLKFDVRKREAA